MSHHHEHENHGHHHHEHSHTEAGHNHNHHHHHDRPPHRPGPPVTEGEKVLVIRPNSGISGDIMVAGLAALAETDEAEMEKMLADLNLPELKGKIRLSEKLVNEVRGSALVVELPDEHEHRTFSDIEVMIQKMTISDKAKHLALKTFTILADAEGAVHGRRPEDVHFHEVGALDSIMDIGLASVLLASLAPDRVICGPLPICDGVIRCQHGLMVSPAPAVMRMLPGVPVTALDSRGETVTPTGLALLKGFEAEFGAWPDITIERQSLAYGTKYFEGVPNGALFALGQGHGLVAEPGMRMG